MVDISKKNQNSNKFIKFKISNIDIVVKCFVLSLILGISLTVSQFIKLHDLAPDIQSTLDGIRA